MGHAHDARPRAPVPLRTEARRKSAQGAAQGLSRIQEARDSLKEKKFIDIEFRAIRKDGNEIWLNNKYFIISLPNANDEYFAGITIDITESKKQKNFYIID